LGRIRSASRYCASASRKLPISDSTPAEALGALGRRDGSAFAEARLRVLASFEARDAFLEDVPVADTVLVLDALAQERGIETASLSSPLLPA
jgi:hypothetical protein